MDIALLLANATPGPWIYSPDRHTHDSFIHRADAIEVHGCISPENGGVVGSSEWTWLEDGDAQLIAAAPDIAQRALDANDIILDLLDDIETMELVGTIRAEADVKARAKVWLEGAAK